MFTRRLRNGYEISGNGIREMLAGVDVTFNLSSRTKDFYSHTFRVQVRVCIFSWYAESYIVRARWWRRILRDRFPVLLLQSLVVKSNRNRQGLKSQTRETVCHTFRPVYIVCTDIVNTLVCSPTQSIVYIYWCNVINRKRSRTVRCSTTQLNTRYIDLFFARSFDHRNAEWLRWTF